MSKKFGKRQKGPPFVQLHYYLLDSQAWHELTPVARCAYTELARLYNGTNNSSIGMSVRRLSEQLPCAMMTASRALNELEGKGFIVPVTIGTFARKDRLASEYRLTSYRCDASGQPPTKAFDPSKRWEGKGAKRTVLKFGLTVSKLNTVTPETRPTVSNISTVRPVSAEVTVSKTSTHIESYHRPLLAGSASPDLPDCCLTSNRIDTKKQRLLRWSTPCLTEVSPVDALSSVCLTT